MRWAVEHLRNEMDLLVYKAVYYFIHYAIRAFAKAMSAIHLSEIFVCLLDLVLTIDKLSRGRYSTLQLMESKISPSISVEKIEYFIE